MNPAPVLVRVAAADHEALLSVLGRVYAANSDYPPHVDVDGSRRSLEDRLFGGGTLVRWVGSIDDVLVGHVVVHAPGEYLTGRYQALALDPTVLWLEIDKLFVDPLADGLGVGWALLTAARAHITGLGGRLVLCVAETFGRAHRLYVQEGLVVVGGFSGVHGRNIVMTD